MHLQLPLLLPTLVGASTVFESIQRETAAAEGPKYSVQLMKSAIYPRGAAPKGQQTVVMTKRDGKRYRCYLPTAPNTTKPSGSNVAQPAPHVASFLQTLKGSCFYRMEGWWTYEFCFMKSVRQFHQEKSKDTAKPDTTVNSITQDYKLGMYWLPEAGDDASESTETEMASDPSTPPPNFRGALMEDPKTRRKYWQQVYGNGTHCDLTGKPRESEVRLQCANEPSHLASIEEVSTCQYVVQFRTSLLCKHPSFEEDKKEDDIESIKCEPLGADGQPLPAAKRTSSESSDKTASGGAAKLHKEAAAELVAEDAAGAAVQPPRPTEVAFDIGQCMLHRKYNYRGAIIGFDRSCKQSEGWIQTMHVDSLKHGRNQPFYHVLPDIRDRPGAQVTYVAQENVLPDTPPEPLNHPLVDEMFTTFDSALGRFVPSSALRAEYEVEAPAE
mmetsp:Transcript_33932/g.56093  ORF Transcript_33932/g.56093 Transcript_33932/m.56093 type:complete len:441 (+) Transcript_33932:115-1437(+)